MLYLETARLILVETSLEVLQTRLQHETFTADVVLPSGVMQVTFPAEWPGDALDLFPMLIEQYQRSPNDVSWGGTMIDCAERVAVGQMGCKGRPRAGAVEIGYGINPAYQQRGYATEMAHAHPTWLLNQPDVSRVTAECRTDNYGSIRVLEKAGFAWVGQRDDDEGLLFVWERTTE